MTTSGYEFTVGSPFACTALPCRTPSLPTRLGLNAQYPVAPRVCWSTGLYSAAEMHVEHRVAIDRSQPSRSPPPEPHQSIAHTQSCQGPLRTNRGYRLRALRLANRRLHQATTNGCLCRQPKLYGCTGAPQNLLRQTGPLPETVHGVQKSISIVSSTRRSDEVCPNQAKQQPSPERRHGLQAALETLQ